MDIYEFCTKEAPKICGVHPSFGVIAGMVLDAEKAGEACFSQEAFSNARDRAKLGLPFNPVDQDNYEYCLDVLEYAILYHRQEHHGEHHLDRMMEIKLTEDEKEMATRDWWNS
jgi:hypothetical protein